MPRVSIIILTWNGRRYLSDCLKSIEAQTYRDFEVILLDNGSRDGSSEFIKNEFSWVSLISVPENLGFAGGHSVAIERASGELIVTLNNDTRVEPDWLEELVFVADSYPEAGMVASRTSVYDDPDLIDTLGGRVCLDGMSRGAFRMKRVSELGLSRVEEGLYPSPAAALYRRSMIEEVGFFDEDFFAYAEDTDLGLRCRWAGWKCVIATEAIVHHYYSATGGAFSPFKLYYCERNHFWVAIKNFPPLLLMLLPITTFIRYVVQAVAVVIGTGSGEEFRTSASKIDVLKALVKAVRDAAVGIPNMWNKRQQIRLKSKLSDKEMSLLLKKYRLGFRELLDW
jgi:GT2 family glycosyltransferase